jgi:hypothetical protein
MANDESKKTSFTAANSIPFKIFKEKIVRQNLS